MPRAEMPAARKYRMRACPKHGHHGHTAPRFKSDWRCPVCVGETAYEVKSCGRSEFVTAYDNRDVDPLVEAARGVLHAWLNPERFDFSVETERLVNALAPFEEGL